jgi:hypothetical protein
MNEATNAVPLIVHDRIAEDELRHVRAVTAAQWSLKAVLDWCLAQSPPILSAEVVTQDEFTHDLLVPLPSGTYLVYDST